MGDMLEDGAAYYEYLTKGAAVKCHRKVCENEASPECVHRDNGELYCPDCAKSINAACEEEVVAGVDREDWEGRNFRDFLPKDPPSEPVDSGVEFLRAVMQIPRGDNPSRGVGLTLEQEAAALSAAWCIYSDAKGRASVCLSELLTENTELRERLAGAEKRIEDQAWRIEFFRDIERGLIKTAVMLRSDDIQGIDPGIRDAVVRMQCAGFVTTDSGDGSKAGEMECALPYPHVYALGSMETLVEDCRKLRAMFPDAVVQGGYSPDDGLVVLAVEWHPGADGEE